MQYIFKLHIFSEIEKIKNSDGTITNSLNMKKFKSKFQSIKLLKSDH